MSRPVSQRVADLPTIVVRVHQPLIDALDARVASLRASHPGARFSRNSVFKAFLVGALLPENAASDQSTTPHATKDSTTMETARTNGLFPTNHINSAPAVQGMKTQVMLVSPEMAAEWLKNNPRNRRVNRSAVTTLAREMKAGRFIFTHQGIALGVDGSLLDGQHRLLALIASGISIAMVVHTDVPLEAMGAIDVPGCGPRTAADVVAITDGIRTNGTTRAAAIAAERIVTGVSIADGGQERITAHVLRQALDRHGASATFVAETIGRAHNRLCQAPANGALTVLHRVYPAETTAFIGMVRDGVGLTERHPALAMRNYLLLSYHATARGSRGDLVDRMFGAFDAYRRGLPRLLSRPNAAAREQVVELWKTKYAAKPNG